MSAGRLQLAHLTHVRSWVVALCGYLTVEFISICKAFGYADSVLHGIGNNTRTGASVHVGDVGEAVRQQLRLWP